MPFLKIYEFCLQMTDQWLSNKKKWYEVKKDRRPKILKDLSNIANVKSLGVENP